MPDNDAPEVAHTWSRMDLKEFHEAGLVWRVNEAVLWPLGLALTIAKDNETGEYTELFVQRVDPFDTIVSGSTKEELESYLSRYTDWLRERLGKETRV